MMMMKATAILAVSLAIGWILAVSAAEPPAAPKPSPTETSSAAAAAWQKHWAFQPIREPVLPAVNVPTWPLTPIDHFVLARLDEKALMPSPPADRRTLLRRVTFDLIGLPPTAEEVDAFVADP